MVCFRRFFIMNDVIYQNLLHLGSVLCSLAASETGRHHDGLDPVRGLFVALRPTGLQNRFHSWLPLPAECRPPRHPPAPPATSSRSNSPASIVVTHSRQRGPVPGLGYYPSLLHTGYSRRSSASTSPNHDKAILLVPLRRAKCQGSHFTFLQVLLPRPVRSISILEHLIPVHPPLSIVNTGSRYDLWSRIASL